VDPDNHTVEQFVLTDGRYARRPDAGLIPLSILEGVAVRLADVW
jgi:hypothetical protein